MEFITLLITALGTAIGDFATQIPAAMVSAFDGLFTSGTGASLALTNLAGGLIAIVGISLVVSVIVKVYNIFSGRMRRSI